jgi:hypothetical protein
MGDLNWWTISPLFFREPNLIYGYPLNDNTRQLFVSMGPEYIKSIPFPYQPCPLFSNDYLFWLSCNLMLQKQNKTKKPITTNIGIAMNMRTM